jgi:hypothetical protein
MTRAAITTKQDERAERRERRRIEREDADMAEVLSTPAGRRFVWRLLGITGVFSASWDPSARIHFNEGRRDVGLRYLAELNDKHPDRFLEAQAEAIADAKREAEQAMLDDAMNEGAD